MFVVVVVIIIYHRCVYELFVAHKLKVKVTLCPTMWDGYVQNGALYEDVCIENINESIDSENAHCSWDSDRNAIHKAIKSLSSNGFDELNKIVEMIRLTYLLEYPVQKITGHEDYEDNSESNKEERRRKAVEEYLVPSITTMLRRVHSIADNEIPTFENVKTQSYLTEPIEVFLKWRKLVEFIIANKTS